MDAIPYLETALKRGGNGSPELYYNLGICYYRTNNYKKAEEALINCLTINQNFAQGYQVLAEVFKAEGKNEEAKQCEERFQKLMTK